MQEKLESVKFNLTSSMSLQLIRFNELKKELIELDELYNENKNIEILNKIKQKEIELIKCRDIFIKEFKLNNKEEVINYLRIKNEN